MPEIKHTFQAGKMNKDLDERLIPKGEYRDALNIEVATSDGNDIGTIQNLHGTIERLSSIDYNVNPTVNHDGEKSYFVGSTTDEKNNDAYFFIASPRISGIALPLNDIKIYKDLIVKYNAESKKVSPVFTDVIRVEIPVVNFFQPEVFENPSSYDLGSMSEYYDSISNVSEGVLNIARVGMSISAHAPNGDNYLSHPFNTAESLNGLSNTIKIREIDKETNTIYFDRDIVGNMGVASFFVLTTLDEDANNKGNNVLKFYRNTHKEPKAKITGINIINNLLLWTDGYSEPKKINLDRLIPPSDLNPFGHHSDLYIEDSRNLISNSLVQLSEIDSSTSSAYKEEHITVIKRAPRTAPELIMSHFEKPIEGDVSYTASAEYHFFHNSTIISGGVMIATLSSPGDELNMSLGAAGIFPGGMTDSAIDGTFYPGMVLLFESEDSSMSATVEVISVDENNVHTVKIISIDQDITEDDLFWDVSIVQKKPIFETKLGRFAYRYKYQDGEYSSFSPWSELAFMPGQLDYIPKKGYNLGMVNNLRRLKITNFIASDYQRPDDVVSVDILFKDTVSPNVYVVKTIRRGYDAEWNDDAFSNLGDDASGVIDITTEMIHKTLPSSQMLRAWDNVPITAKTQEVSGNRIVYANYEQNYDVLHNVRVIPSAIHDDHSDHAEALYPVKSVKSIRSYKLGVVFGDKYGRETPVLGIGGKVTSSTFNDNYGDVITEGTILPDSVDIDKRYAHKVNKLQAELNWSDEILQGSSSDWMEYYKYYIKETSNEYYNLVMDRWYPAEDGNVWLSFQSADRNKVDIETYLTLKNEHGSENPVEEEARYKILAIKNEAPRFIKTTNRIIGRATLNDDAGYDLSETMTVNITDYSINFEGYQPEGILWARIIGSASGVVRYSQWVKVARMNDQNGDIRLVKPFGESGNMEGPSQFGSASGLTVQIEIRDAVEENKPEFEGRFFVKVFKDLTLTNQVLGDFQFESSWASIGSYRIGYVGPHTDDQKNPAVNSAYQGDYSQSTENFDNTSDNYADGSSSNYYDREWTNVTAAGTAHGVEMAWQLGHTNGDNNAVIDFWDFYWNEDDTVNGHDTGKKKYKWFLDEARWAPTNNMCDGNIDNVSDPSHSAHGSESLYHSSSFDNVDGVNACRVSGLYDGDQDPLTMAFSGQFMQVGTKFRFRSDPGDNADGNQVIYQIIGHSDEWGESANFRKCQGTIWNTHLNCCYECEQSDHILCRRKTFKFYFSRLDDGSRGLDINHWDPRTAVSHDGRTTMFIEVVDTNFDNPDEVQTNVGNAIWETEPKESVDIDLYYEATSAIPLRLNNTNITSFAPTKSTVDLNRSNSTVNPVSPQYTYAIPFLSTTIQESLQASPIVKYATRDIVGLGNLNTGVDDTRAYPIAIGDTMRFTRSNGMVTEAKVIDHWEPIKRYNNIKPFDYTPLNSTEPVTYEGDISSYRPSKNFVINQVQVGNTMPLSGSCGTNIFYAPTSQVENSGIDTSGDTIYEVSSDTLNIEAGTFTTVAMSTLNFVYQNNFEVNDNITGIKIYNSTLNGDCVQQVIPSGTHTIKFREVTGFYRLDYKVHKGKTTLPWFNCYSFGNGLESDRIRDDFNAPMIDNGVKVSTGLEDYGRERRGSGLIWSGIYNSTSGVNKLNEFNMAESITKDLNPSYGSIQALKTRDTNVLAFCEDKVLKILANKDALFNADGSSNVTASNAVLGNAIGLTGDFGISSNPESLAWDGFRGYFADKQRGKVFRLSQDGLTPISDVGMESYFRDNLKNTSSLIGTFDEVKGEYNLTLKFKPHYGEDVTVSFNEKTKGWPSFKSFVPDTGLSINSEYVTAAEGSIWTHHYKGVDPDGNLLVPTNTFYGKDLVPSTVEVIFNEEPGSVKGFTSMNYEGTQAKINEFNYDGITGFEADQTPIPFMNDGEYYNLEGKNGWYVEDFETDLQKCSILEFKDKEGKWFSFINGLPTTIDNLDTGEFTVQGIGVPGDVIIEDIVGCMDPAAVNYNPDATVQFFDAETEAPCYYNLPGCMDPTALNYDPYATVPGEACIEKIVGCMYSWATNYNPEANVQCDPLGDEWWDGWVTNTVTGDCCETVPSAVAGCMDDGNKSIANGDGFDSPYPGITALNVCVSPICDMHDQSLCEYALFGCTNSLASNFNPLANTDDGSCIVENYGCTDENYLEYSDQNTAPCQEGIDAFLTTDEMCEQCETLKIIGCLDVAANNYLQNATQSLEADANFHDQDECTYSLFGCTDPNANNYNADSNTDDGSCTYFEGCMGPVWAINHDDQATLDDGSCIPIIYGCMDENSINYNPNANMPHESHPYYTEGITTLNQVPDAESFLADAIIAYGIDWEAINSISEACQEIVIGCTDSLATNYDENANTSCDGCCEYPVGPFDLEVNEEGTECDGPGC